MNRLEEIRRLREEIQNEYFELAQEIWISDLELSKKDYKTRKEYDKYRNKDRFLERLESMEESMLEDLDFFYKKLR